MLARGGNSEKLFLSCGAFPLTLLAAVIYVFITTSAVPSSAQAEPERAVLLTVVNP